MKKAELNIVQFDENDVIATSILMMSGLDDNIEGNITFNGKQGLAFKNAYGDKLFYGEYDARPGNTLYTYDKDGDEAPEFNGAYTWDSASNMYVHPQ